jgi:DNA-binding XRE family transcriptional regulator
MASRRSKRTLPTLGDKAREARKLAGMNQHQLAKAVGCSYTKIVHIENGRGAEPWLIDAVAKRLGFESLRDLVVLHADTQALIQNTPLPGTWKARFDGSESPDMYREFLAKIERSLADVPGLIEFTFSRPANSLIFGVRATIDKHQRAISKLGYRWVFRVKTPQLGRIRAHVYKMRLPRITLDWPLSDFLEPFPRFLTLRDYVADYVRRGRIKARFYPDGSAVLLATKGETATRPSSDPVSR